MSDKVTPATKYTGPAEFVQQAPEQGDESEIYQLVLIDIITRSQFGARKYGHALRTSADVDFLTNLYQELLDALIYIRGELHRRDSASGITVDRPDLMKEWITQIIMEYVDGDDAKVAAHRVIALLSGSPPHLPNR